MTSKAEETVRAKYERAGWTVVHGGAPDFLLLKDGWFPRFVEVKANRNRLQPNQQLWRLALRRFGAVYELERIPEAIHMRTFNVPMEDRDYERLEAAKERLEEQSGDALTWRDFLSTTSEDVLARPGGKR